MCLGAVFAEGVWSCRQDNRTFDSVCSVFILGAALGRWVRQGVQQMIVNTLHPRQEDTVFSVGKSSALCT